MSGGAGRGVSLAPGVPAGAVAPGSALPSAVPLGKRELPGGGGGGAAPGRGGGAALAALAGTERSGAAEAAAARPPARRIPAA